MNQRRLWIKQVLKFLLNELNSIKKDVIVVITTHDERILSYGEEILYL